MAYQIDFTASNYASRRRRKAFLRLLLLAAIAGVVWGMYDVYTTYNQPTLNMKLVEYEAAAYPIEEINRAWDAAEREYKSMVRYYRLLWAANATNFLGAVASGDAIRLGLNLSPRRSWTLTTGGECRLDYSFAFRKGDKARQTYGLETNIVNAVTSVVEVVGGKVDVQGVKHENLLAEDELDITIGFSLADVKPFPKKEDVLSKCVKEISDLRRKVHGMKIAVEGGSTKTSATVEKVMQDYLMQVKDAPDFPFVTNVISVSGWFERADKFIAKNNTPGDVTARKRLKDSWAKVGDARFPWQRFRDIDNDQLLARAKALGAVSDGVRRFKGFLNARHADCLKKLEPFVEAYRHTDVFNEPFIEFDLTNRVAGAAGIARSRVVFTDETGIEPSVLEKEDNKYIFTWVRWRLLVGDAINRDGERGDAYAATKEPLTIAGLMDCARRALELGPGYALDKLRVNFNAGGNVSGAVMEGLLPVKSVEVKKEAAGNDD